MKIIRRVMQIFGVLSVLCGLARADHVLLIGPSPGDLVTSWQSGHGHTVDIGPNYDAFDGTIDLSGYDSVLLSVSDWTLPDMPTAGPVTEPALVDYVANGGGLVTAEWLLWRFSSVPVGSFALIDPILPAYTIDGAYIDGNSGSVVFRKVSSDPILNQGMPDSFTISLNNEGSGLLQTRPGATVFYSGDDINGLHPSPGVVGWQYGLGRVIVFSTTLQTPIGPDVNLPYSQLISNAIDWAGASTATVPEPATIHLTLIGAMGIWAAGRHRSRRKGR